MNLNEVIQKQRDFAFSGKAKDLSFRRGALKKLKQILLENEQALYQAIHQDFKKSQFETYMTELSLIHHEINLNLKKLKRWSRPQRVWTNLANFPGRSFIMPQPYGHTLIIGAWNYPFQLTLVPLISAVAAGNNCILKPSELSSNASKILAQLINTHFDPAFLYVAEGGAEVTQELLSHKFDKIFFTGSTAIGKLVAKAAAEHLTPVTLELGGKSPCIVLADCDLKIAAQRIAWGKCLNAGQTCVAPDYVLVERSFYEAFLSELKAQMSKVVGPNPLQSESYLRIINARHFQRLEKLIDQDKVYAGGTTNAAENFIEPTILRDIKFSDEVMKEEIFGPILPVIPFDRLDEVIMEIKQRPHPLALYVFGKNEKRISRILQETSFGGGAVNDVLIHLSNSRLPFGGVGTSGMGAYHGEHGFKNFSHYKSILSRPSWFELPIKYAPYKGWKLKIIRLLLGS
ncbi:MAG: aldehyde dehydrogenase [Bacteriovoracaceae bacterium]|nr:aldehyde dehydrogenase [Bacteriovoracaceae bacterium]